LTKLLVVPDTRGSLRQRWALLSVPAMTGGASGTAPLRSLSQWDGFTRLELVGRRLADILGVQHALTAYRQRTPRHPYVSGRTLAWRKVKERGFYDPGARVG
jgi:hypothetical protein